MSKVEKSGVYVAPNPNLEEQDFLEICSEGVSTMFPDRSATKDPLKLTYRIFSFTTLPGARLLCGGNVDGSIDIIHPETNDIEMTLKGHVDSVMAIAISPHGIFSASADREIRRWSLKDFSEMKVYYGHESMVSALVVASVPGNTGLISASDDRTIMQWNIESGLCIYVYQSHDAPINALGATAEYIFSGDADGVVICHDLSRRVRMQKKQAHAGSVWCICYNEDMDTLYSGGEDGNVRIWHKFGTDGSCTSVLKGHRGPIRSMIEYGGTLFTGGADSVVACWDTRIPAKSELLEVWRLYGEDGSTVCTKPITALGLANNELVAGGFDRIINRWDVVSMLAMEQDYMDLPPLYALEDLKEAERQASMPPQDRHFLYCRLEVDEAVKKYTELPLNYILDSLQYKVTGSWLTSELMVYIPFLIMFLFFFLQEINAMEVFYMNEGIASLLETEDIGLFKLRRSFMEITSASYWNIWVTGLFFGQMWGDKETTPWYEAFRFQGANQLIGAVRFRTQRVRNDSCTFNNDIFDSDKFATNEYDFFPTGLDPETSSVSVNFPCYGPHGGISSTNLDTKPFACAFPLQSGCIHNLTEMKMYLSENAPKGFFQYDATAGQLYRGLEFYETGGYIVDIPAFASGADATKMADVMVRNGFVDDTATRLVAIEFFSYNPTLQVYAQHRMFAEVFLGGAWHVNVEHIPFKLFRLDSSRWKLIYEIIFLLFVVYWLVNYFFRMIRDTKVTGSTFSFIFNLWNLLDLTNVIIFLVMFYFRWLWFSGSQEALTEMPFDGRYYPHRMDTIVAFYRYQVYLNAVNTILTFLKILKYMQLNDQLNLLTRTLAAAQQNIVGVLGLFVYFVFAFAITGHAVYGTTVFGYRTLDASYNTLLRLLVGDQDYEAMSREAVEYTVCFYWAFVISAMFMLLNFLIAVLSDAFNEVCASRLPISLDKAIVRAANEVKRNFLPNYLRITLMLLVRRKSRTELTAKQTRLMRLYRDSILSEEAKRWKDYDEVENVYIPRDWFMNHVPKELRTEDNLNFMDEVWFDMSWEWHFKLRDKYMQQQHEQTEVVDQVLTAELAPLGTRREFLEDCVGALSNINTRLSQLGAEM